MRVRETYHTLFDPFSPTITHHHFNMRIGSIIAVVCVVASVLVAASEVLELNESNFDKALADHSSGFLVEFFAPCMYPLICPLISSFVYDKNIFVHL